MRLKTRTDIRQLAALRNKRDLNILFKPEAAKPKVVEVSVPEVKKEEAADLVVPPTDPTDVELPSGSEALVTDAVDTKEDGVKEIETSVEASGTMEVDKAEI